jgi:uncharacterized lipoprotein YbaY
MVRSTITGVWILAAAFGCQPTEGKTPALDPVDAPEDTKAMAQLNVEVFYRERIMLPPTSTVEVVLEDGAKMDVAAELVTKAEVPVKTGPPYRVTLEYDPAVLSLQGRYGVRGSRTRDDCCLRARSSTLRSARTARRRNRRTTQSKYW